MNLAESRGDLGDPDVCVCVHTVGFTPRIPGNRRGRAGYVVPLCVHVRYVCVASVCMSVASVSVCMSASVCGVPSCTPDGWQDQADESQEGERQKQNSWCSVRHCS